MKAMNASKLKADVFEKLKSLSNTYELDNFDLDNLADQIVENQDQIKVLDEKDDNDEEFLSIASSFAKNDQYVLKFNAHRQAGYSLIGNRKDRYIYQFEKSVYLSTGGYGRLFVDIGHGLINTARNSSLTIEAFDLLADTMKSSVVELPRLLLNRCGYIIFDDKDVLSATDESDVYAWLQDNVRARDIIDILEDYGILKAVIGKYDRTLETFEIDFSDLFE